jgi:hypothetical protein
MQNDQTKLPGGHEHDDADRGAGLAALMQQMEEPPATNSFGDSVVVCQVNLWRRIQRIVAAHATEQSEGDLQLGDFTIQHPFVGTYVAIEDRWWEFSELRTIIREWNRRNVEHMDLEKALESQCGYDMEKHELVRNS